MVSTRLLVVLIAAGSAYSQAPANLFDTRSNPTATLPKPEPNPPLTLERRGDIYMARKMYREAIETYMQAPQDDPVVLNKLGIAYHQLLDFPTARKWYERSVKVKPSYAEALNNLGTVYYAQKSYR